jgi:LPXTG-site transpeptidase (sortase) family protein
LEQIAVEGTPLPGEPRNSGIAGHHDTFFRELKDIRKNDEIQLQTATALLRYEVDWVKVVAPDDSSVLAPSTESAITLVTYYPFILSVLRQAGSSCAHTSFSPSTTSSNCEQF